jgi:hypothetical protein
MEFWTIEVLDGQALSAEQWRQAHGEHLIEAALTNRAHEWAWVSRGWGVLLEVGFLDEVDWLRFRASSAVQAALDAVPDPVNGLLVYSGRGGSSAAPVLRRPRRPRGAGAAALPVPDAEPMQPPPGLQQASLDTDLGAGVIQR